MAKYLRKYGIYALLALLAGSAIGPTRAETSEIEFLAFQTDDVVKGDEDKRKPLVVEWREVRGAYGYTVQIRDASGNMRVNKRVATNRIEFFLEPEEYEIRVAALNKFRRPSQWTPWRALRIIRPKDPVVTSIEPAVAEDGKDGKKSSVIIIKGKNFVKATKVDLYDKGRKLPVKEVVVEDANTIRVTVDTDQAKSEKYDMVVQNPGKRIFTKRDTVAVLLPEERKDADKKEPDDKKDAVVKKDTEKKEPDDKKDTVVKKDTDKKEPDDKKDVVVKKDTDKKEPDDKKDAVVKKDADKKEPVTDEERRVALMRKDPFSQPQTIAQNWPRIFPGIGQFQDGNRLAGSAWIGLYTSYAAAGYMEYQKAEAAAAKSNSDPFLVLFTQPALLLQARNSLGLDNTTIVGLAFVAQNRNEELKASHAQHRQNQYGIAGAALLTYLGHIHGQRLSQWNLQMFVPGLPNFRRGETAWGFGWITAITALAAGAYASEVQADSIAASLQSDINYQIFNNPLAMVAFANNFSSQIDNNTFLTLALSAQNSVSDASHRYKSARSAQKGLAGAAVSLYLFHVVKELLRADVPARVQPAAKNEDSSTARSASEPDGFFTFGQYPGTRKGDTITEVRYHWRF